MKRLKHTPIRKKRHNAKSELRKEVDQIMKEEKEEVLSSSREK
jgi:hypothetical protein